MVRLRLRPWLLAQACDTGVDDAETLGAAVVADDVGHPLWLDTGRPLAAIGFPWTTGGRTAQAYALPCDPRPSLTSRNHAIDLECGGQEKTTVHIRASPPRVAGLPGHHHPTPLEMQVHWMQRGFQELLGEDEGRALRLSDGFRRVSWTRTASCWIDPEDSAGAASLIFHLARDTELWSALDSVSSGPRRILERIREPERLARIQEMDGHCLRDLARRPGHSIAEKAGPRQEILAVKRRESFATLENRVAAFVLEEIEQLAWEWRDEHRRITGDRATVIARSERKALAMRQRPNLTEVLPVAQHPARANYPLQFESRYALIYKAYQQVLRERRARDEAWIWQQALWSETMSVLCAGALADQWTGSRSSLYLRSHAEQGNHILQGTSPGLLESPGGACLYIDASDVRRDPAAFRASGFPYPDFPGQVGFDAVLWWPRAQRILGLWFVRTPADHQALNLLQAEAERCMLAAPPGVRALLIHGKSSGSAQPSAAIERHGRVSSLEIPSSWLPEHRTAEAGNAFRQALCGAVEAMCND
jgi:hypothetical protein